MCLSLIVAGAWAQPGTGNIPVSGQIENMPAAAVLHVELRGGEDFFTRRTSVSGNGRFEFAAVRPGGYRLIVTDSVGRFVYDEWVAIDYGSNHISARLPPPSVAKPGSGTVSIQTLKRKAPRRAVREYRKSLKYLKKGATEEAVMHLQNAIRLAPDYTEAHNALGICYVQQEELDKAAAQFQSAVRLAPGNPALALNLGTVLLELRRFAEAVLAARRALRLDPGLAKARLILGLGLHELHQDGRETMVNLKRAAGQFSRAHLAIAQILVERGHPAAAAAELKKYLRKPDGAMDPKIVASWVASLEPQVSASPAGPKDRTRPSAAQ